MEEDKLLLVYQGSEQYGVVRFLHVEEELCPIVPAQDRVQRVGDVAVQEGCKLGRLLIEPSLE